MRDKLSRSIAKSVGGYLVFQILLFLGFAFLKDFFRHYGVLFLSLTLAFHGVLLVMLLAFKGDFVLESTGEVLDHINVANRITLFRVSTLPTLLVLIMAARDYRIRMPLLALVLLVFLSDFADGYVSRRWKQVTKLGRMLDSASDYSLLVVLTVVFYYFGIIPLWFFALVVGRLFLQAGLMGILILVRRRIEPKTTMMGKVAVATIMVLYAAEIGRIGFGLGQPGLFRVLEGLAGAIVLASVVDKVLAFARELKAGPKQAKESPEA